MKRYLIIGVIVLLAGVAVAYAMGEIGGKSYSLRYKITVAVETPEGMKTGSAVRQMGNSTPVIDLPDVGNPADVRGEAVVVDMGKRGVLFALISHESDNRFYDAFPLPGHSDGQGGSSPEGIKHYASLPIGTTGTLNPAEPPGYPKLVTFKDLNDPKSVTLSQVWKRDDRGYYYLDEDRMEELFGKGVKLKDITLEITDDEVTWVVVDKYLLWLKDFCVRKTRLNGSTSIAIMTNDLADNLGAGSFSTGE